MTDRGPRPLPAWNLRLTGMSGLWTVLSSAVETWWPVGWTSMRIEHGRPCAVDSAGGQLRYLFMTGGGRHLTYRAGEVHETDRAVHVTVEAIRRGPAPSFGTFDRAGRAIDVALTTPLWNRVLIDHIGSPLPVVQS